ncbi:hypothetical protein E3T54_15000 [Cryobacterium sp. Sr8]|uniref:hypothetical protein n=1 Tax=Cryobacterium sp. Sr8 TaxID=1259203 RepID=UPI00106A61D8|nr:hypothetical protein [Cryobacterium sp. Sr8]TFD74105.1 hypothetical protein E3T54_15000 [Cryobacterium sp. Sr8]
MHGAQSGPHLSDFADRLLDLVAQAATVRAYAQSTGNGRLLLQAIQNERETLALLMTRLGIDSDEAVELFHEAKTLTKAVAAAVRSGEHPALAAALTQRLTDDGLDHLAASLRELASDSLTEPIAAPDREEI